MRVTGAHELAAVLEDLDPARALAELVRLISPDVDHRTNLLGAHQCETEVVARRKADHATGSAFALGDGQAVFKAPFGGTGGQRAEVVVEDERPLVVGVAGAVGSLVAGTEVAARIVWLHRRLGRC